MEDDNPAGHFHCPFCNRVQSTWVTMKEHLRWSCPDIMRKDRMMEQASPKGPSRWGW